MTKLEMMLKYVSEHNEFYRNRIKEYGIKDPLDITQWPILTRKELQENRYNMFSDGYKSKYFNQQLRRQSSSGSSGIPVNVYWDYKDWYASNMSLWRKRLQWYNIHPSDKYIIFTLNAFNEKNDGETVYYVKEYENVLTVNVSLIQNESGYVKLIDIINEFEPKWFYVQPSILNRLILAYKYSCRLPPNSLEYIESVGELLPTDVRKRATDFFNTPFANMYGSEEMNGIAYECPDHHMHILDNNVYLESTDDNEAIITNLNNYAMPIIRYNQGDEIIIDKTECPCSYEKNHNAISLVRGRTFDEIVIGNTVINSIYLFEFMSEIMNQYNDLIISYRFTYTQSTRRLICWIELFERHTSWFSNIEKAILNVFSEKNSNFNLLNFEVKLQDNCKYSKKKHRVFEITE